MRLSPPKNARRINADPTTAAAPLRTLRTQPPPSRRPTGAPPAMAGPKLALLLLRLARMRDQGHRWHGCHHWHDMRMTQLYDNTCRCRTKVAESLGTTRTRAVKAQAA